MTFDPTIPNATHFVSADQPQITINFGQLNTIFDIDHVKYNDATVGNRGKHKQVTLIAPVAAAAAGTEGIVHSVNGVASSVSFNGIPLPFFSNSVGDFPIFPDILKGAGNDWSCKIGKLIFNFGFNTTNGANPNTRAITFNQAYTASSTLLNVSCTRSGASYSNLSDMQVISAVSTGFSARTSLTAGAQDFYYLAIGY